MGSITNICEFCGKEFSTEDFSRDTTSERFCSSSCAHKYSASYTDSSRLYEDCTCKRCNTSFRILKRYKHSSELYCDNCKKLLEKEQEEKLRVISPQRCQCCGKIFTRDYRSLSSIKKGPAPRFCSFECSHSRPKTEAQKKQVSEALKNSKKAKEGIERAKVLKESKEWRDSHPHIIHPRIQKTCPVCGKIFETTETRNKKYCSNDCWKKVSGGFREGSAKNYKHGYVEDYYYDSSWEEIWLKWALLKGIHFERNKQGFPYIFKGKQHLYYPDFYLPDSDEYVEIKGLQDEQWCAKREAFPYKLTVYTRTEIQCIEQDLNFL